MKILTLNGQKLKEITQKSNTAKSVAKLLASRERMRHLVNIERLKLLLKQDGEKVIDADYIQYWKDLESEGLGNLNYSRSSIPETFSFNYDLRAISKAALQGSNEPALAVDTKGKKKPKGTMRVTSTDNQPPTKTINKSFKLSIDIPEDMSKERIQKLLHALKTI